MSFNEILNDKGALVKMWNYGVQIDENTRQQALDLARLPFIYRNVSLMPDAHLGKGATIGSVVPTIGAVIPAAVGVDIGCGMLARRFDFDVDRLQDHDIERMRALIEKAVPHGRTDNGGDRDRGAWGQKAPDVVMEQWTELATDARYTYLCDKYGKDITRARTWQHLGTLGTGNHFIEVEVDQKGKLWVMIHSGSRGIGARIGNFFMRKAKEECQRWCADKWLPNMDLSFFPQGSPYYDDYMAGMMWAQEYAWKNRQMMMHLAVDAVKHILGKARKQHVQEVHCHHNYADMENHFGQNVLVTRKGAICARVGDWGLIPGAMGRSSYVVAGKGDKDSFTSASHGAGRLMSRTQAKREFSVEEHAQATEGIACDKGAGTLDETPMAYKDIDAVLKAEEALVEVKFELYPKLVVKGIGEGRTCRGEEGIDS